jgi:hypothetical protein
MEMHRFGSSVDGDLLHAGRAGSILNIAAAMKLIRKVLRPGEE